MFSDNRDVTNTKKRDLLRIGNFEQEDSSKFNVVEKIGELKKK